MCKGNTTAQYSYTILSILEHCVREQWCPHRWERWQGKLAWEQSGRRRSRWLLRITLLLYSFCCCRSCSSGNECTENADSASDPECQSVYVAVEGNLAITLFAQVKHWNFSQHCPTQHYSVSTTLLDGIAWLLSTLLLGFLNSAPIYLTNDILIAHW